MITTVGGLVVGIATMFAYNHLVYRVDKVVSQMEARTIAFMDLMNEPNENKKPMSLKRRQKISPAFSMSSMTDLIFLLLIFL